MWFKHSPDHDAPERLPPELAALGEQLQSDAQWLGKTYPSCQPPLTLLAELERRGRRQWYFRAWAVGVATGAALLLIAVSIVAFWNAPTNDLPATVAAAHAADPVDADSMAAVNVPVQPVSYRPALAEVNGPELEGLLDLLDEQPQSAAVISF